MDELLSAGKFPRSTVGDPGVQGAGVTGIQGIGVKTPKAAAVADATVGFAGEVHIPKGLIFVMGMVSMILASGVSVFPHHSSSKEQPCGYNWITC